MSGNLINKIQELVKQKEPNCDILEIYHSWKSDLVFLVLINSGELLSIYFKKMEG